jgi:hypothetical protein
MNDTIISLDVFMAKCYMREHYVGYVIGLGYISAWKAELVSVDRPINNPSAFVGNAQFSYIIDVPVIIPIMPPPDSRDNNEYKGKVASWGGTAATAGTIINKALIMEPKYIQVNPQGTLMKNPKFGQIKLGTKPIAGGLGWIFLGASIYYDVKAHNNKEITKKEMWVDIVINGTIFGIGVACPVAGVILGLLYMGITASPGPGANASYEEIHGSITPADNTRVNILKKELPVRRVIQVREPPVIRQGR